MHSCRHGSCAATAAAPAPVGRWGVCIFVPVGWCAGPVPFAMIMIAAGCGRASMASLLAVAAGAGMLVSGPGGGPAASPRPGADVLASVSVTVVIGPPGSKASGEGALRRPSMKSAPNLLLPGGARRVCLPPKPGLRAPSRDQISDKTGPARNRQQHGFRGSDLRALAQRPVDLATELSAGATASRDTSRSPTSGCGPRAVTRCTGRRAARPRTQSVCDLESLSSAGMAVLR